MNAELLHDALNLLPGDLIAPVDALRAAPRKPKNAWLRYAALAACAALVLWCGMLASRMFSAGSTMESAAQMEADLEYSHISGSGNMGGAPAADGTANYEKAPTDCDCAAEAIEESAPLAPEKITIDPPATGGPSGPDKYYVGGSAGYAVTFGHKEGVEYPQVTVIRSRQELDNHYDAYRDYYDMDSLEDGCTHWTESFFAEHDLLLILVMENDGYDCPQVGYLNEQEDGSWELTFPGTWEVGEGIDAETPWHIYVEIKKGLIAENDTITLKFEPNAVPEESYVEASTIPLEPTGGK